jgi:hypothetical protein
MEETIYQDVWCRAFASMWQWCSEQDGSTPKKCENMAAVMANKAAAAAVRRWDEAKRLAAITAKNKEEGK